jgi:A/G-specific adenine glycosylase
VASIAFNQPVAALDGNVKRIMGRLFPEGSSPPKGGSQKDLEKSLEDWIPTGRASDFNQALMDLGAAICLPSRPRCSACPVRRFCVTQGKSQEKKPAVKKFREESWAIALVGRDGKFLLHRNQAKGLLAGLWQFPKVVAQKNQGKDTNPLDPRKSLKKYLLEEFHLKVKMKSCLPEQEYFFTHIHALMQPYLCSLADPGNLPPPSKSVRWVKPSNFSRYPISTAMRKMAALLER